MKKSMNICLIFLKLINFANYFIIDNRYVHYYLIKKVNIIKLFTFLKYDSYFKLNFLLDIQCDDILYFSKKYRYKITYIFLNPINNFRFFFTLFVKWNESILSLKDIYSSSVFLEREIWDLFGVYFNNKMVMRRILTDYGFKGHTLRKDFPLTGFYECIFFFEKGRIKQKPLNLLQEYRKFNYKNYK